MKYNISYERNGVYQAIIVDAPNKGLAEAYFQRVKPDARICGTHLATRDDERPGKPVMVMPEGRWKGAGMGDFCCSLCGEEVSGKPDFCPCCHAYMS